MRLLYLYDLPLPVPLAAPIQILQTASAMARQGHDVTTAWATVADPAEALRFYGVPAHDDLRIVPFYTRWTRLTPRRSIGRLVDRLGPFDAVMSRGEAGVAAFAAIGRTPGRPAFVYEAHRRVRSDAIPATDTFAGPRRSRLERREADAVRGADGLVFISEGVRDALAEEYHPTSPKIVLPSGVTVDDADDAQPRDLDVLYAGKLERRKGVDLMLDATAHLPGVRLALVGGSAGQVVDVRQAASERGVGERVDLAGYVEPGRVRGYFRRARVGVCPLPAGVSEVSDRFTSPMKILEMMAAGTPVVATDLPSVREILAHDRNALLVPPNDPAALASAVRRLLDDRGLAGRLAAQARIDVEPYSWGERARRLAAFVSGVVEARRAKGQT